jgi:anhydro-N-acetylmuramic acid kinase
MALGGQGAPLVSYFDVVVLGHPTENRLALNLGGIANFTVLPAQSAASREYIAMDTGPANMVMDALASRFLGARYDDRGSAAARGVPNELVVYELLEDPYFLQPPPKTTGRELFGKDFVDRMIAALAARGTSVPEDMLATAAELTARSVHLAFDRFVSHHGSSPHGIDRVIASGGGIRNDYLMRRLRELFAPVAVETTDDHGIPSEAKEALCFALLAHEYVNGVATSIPTATGATSATMLGKLCLPGRRV